jgi:hypothetical protein
MRTFQYEVTPGPNGKRIRDAGPDIQRSVAADLAAVAIGQVHRPRGAEGLAAVRAGQFGDSPLRRALQAESHAAEERYGLLAEEKEEAEERGEVFPADLATELIWARETYKLYSLLAATLSSDPAEAALEAALGLHGLLSTSEAEGAINSSLAAAGVPEPTGSAW